MHLKRGPFCQLCGSHWIFSYELERWHYFV